MIVRSYNPVWLFVDLNGNVLDDRYYLFTLQNTLPYLPSPIWKDESQITLWSDPIQFLANGTLPENMYWDSDLVYRLEVRDGPTQADALIYLVENYKPGSSVGPAPGSAITNTTNQITNPQFADLNFDGTMTITTATTTEIGPGWSIVTTGPGTSLEVSQVTYTGDSYTPDNASNASTGLRIVNNGFSTVQLRQRFDGNGALWTGAESSADLGPGVAVAYTASSTDTTNLEARIEFSNGTQDTSIFIESLEASNSDHTGASIILKSTNTDQPDVAWTDFVLKFTANTAVEITSVQLIGQKLVQEMPYLQTTPERQVDEEFNYYKDPLEYKPIPSYLVAWDFPLNPAQLFGDTVSVGAIGANKSSYVWDQTIIFQTVNNTLSVARNSASNALNIVVSTTPSSFALIQYLPEKVAREILSQNNAIQIKANVSTGTLNGTASLWWTTDATLPDLNSPTFNSLVSSITSGVPSCANGTWTQVPNIQTNIPSAPFTLSATSSEYNFMGYNGGSTAATSAKYMAIVIAFDTMPITTTLTIDYCSLVGGDIATRPAPQTPDEVLRECSYYFEMSYTDPSLVGTATDSGAHECPMNSYTSPGSTSAFCYPTPFNLVYLIPKIRIPITTIYSTTGVQNNVNAKLFYALLGTNAFTVSQADCAETTFWTKIESTKSIVFLPKIITALTSVANSSNTSFFTSGGISFQYRADARLGIVL